MSLTRSGSPYTDILLGLLNHYSPSGYENAAVKWMVEHMRANGYDESERDPAGNAVGRVGDGPLHIMLLGHIDTVLGELPVRKDGDLIYARGSVDAKGALAAFLAAAPKAAKLSGLRVTVIGAVREEEDSAGAVYVREHHDPPDYLIIGEPSRWDRIAIGYKGSASYDLHVERSVTHTTTPASTACELAVGAWERLRVWTDQLNADREKLFDQLTATLRTMHSKSDGFVEHAQLRVGFRLPYDIGLGELDAQVRHQLVETSVQATRQPGAVAAYGTSKNTPLVHAALAAIRSKGGNPSFVVKTGTSDMNIVAPAWKCPVIAYGPGDSKLDHTPDEHISLTEYQASIAVLYLIMELLENRHTEVETDETIENRNIKS